MMRGAPVIETVSPQKTGISWVWCCQSPVSSYLTIVLGSGRWAVSIKTMFTLPWLSHNQNWTSEGSLDCDSNHATRKRQLVICGHTEDDWVSCTGKYSCRQMPAISLSVEVGSKTGASFTGFSRCGGVSVCTWRIKRGSSSLVLGMTVVGSTGPGPLTVLWRLADGRDWGSWLDGCLFELGLL